MRRRTHQQRRHTHLNFVVGGLDGVLLSDHVDDQAGEGYVEDFHHAVAGKKKKKWRERGVEKTTPRGVFPDEDLPQDGTGRKAGEGYVTVPKIQDTGSR